LAQNESLLYVVDFEENMGSAVLAADDRIYTPILAVTESGSLLTSVDKIPYIQGENYDEADLTNFSLYNANEDDYYVGIADNFALEVCEKYATSQVLQTSDETAGFNYWSNLIGTGRITQAQALSEFSESTENTIQVAAKIPNGIWYDYYG
jgi:hypothetical protein